MLDLFVNEKFWQAVVAGGIAAFASMGGKLYADHESERVGKSCHESIVEIVKHYEEK
jgi:hypothetical protein